MTESPTTPPQGWLARWGRFSGTHPWRVIGAWVIALAILVGLSMQFGTGYSNQFTIPNSETQDAIDLLATEFPAASGDSANIVFKVDGNITDPQFKSKMDAVIANASELPGVLKVIGPDQNPMQISQNGNIAYVQLVYNKSAMEIKQDDVKQLFNLVDAANTDGFQVEVGGQIASAGEFPEMGTSEIIGIVIAMIILLVMFGTIIAMGLPILTAIIGVGTGMIVMPLMANIFDINGNIATAFLSMMGLGVGIDYALFIMNRYRDSLMDGMSVPDAVSHATNTAARSVSFAGTTVAIGLLGLAVIQIPFVTGLGITGATVVVLSVLVALFLMPAILGLIGTRLLAWRIPGFGKIKEGRNSIWYKWAALIQKRPGIISIVTIAGLLLIASPYLDMELNLTDSGNNPTTMHTRRAYDLMKEGFGPGSNGLLMIVVQNPDGLKPEELKSIQASIKDADDVKMVLEPQPNETGTTAIFQVIPESGPQDTATSDLVKNLRENVLPKATEGTDIQHYVGGATSANIDMSQKISDRMPLFYLIVVGLSVVVLIVVFRSIVVPVKAALTTLLSVGASFGATVAVFQWGWLRDVIGLDTTAPIESFMPMILFGVVFGLSMDYEMFLLSRVHEEYTHGRSASDSLKLGMGFSGKVVAAAGAIMAAVFLSFVLGDMRMLKEMGFGLGMAIVFDAFIVRLILVPAIMSALGDRAWWFPSWLDKITPRVNVEGLPEASEASGTTHTSASPAQS